MVFDKTLACALLIYPSGSRPKGCFWEVATLWEIAKATRPIKQFHDLVLRIVLYITYSRILKNQDICLAFFEWQAPLVAKFYLNISYERFNSNLHLDHEEIY